MQKRSSQETSGRGPAAPATDAVATPNSDQVATSAAPQQQATLPPTAPLIVGIDWADKRHDFHILGLAAVECGQLVQDPQTIDEWVKSLQQRTNGAVIRIAIEQSRGALIHALLEHPGLELYPLNPKQLARFREALYPTGGKSDPGDAELLALFLQAHHDKLRPYQPDDEETRRIRQLALMRRQLVEERKALLLKLLAAIKQYFPALLVVCGNQLNDAVALEILTRFPTLEELQRLHPKTLRKILSEHGLKNDQQQTTFIETIRSSLPLTRDRAIVQPFSLLAKSLARQIRDLNLAIAEFEAELKTAVSQHPDNDIFRSCPGAGDALVPRLIAAFGSNRDRFESAQCVQAYSGIAPITRQSGKSKVVLQRFACPKFVKQTFHEFADHARKWSSWSRAFYDMQIAAGVKHHAAVRALAFKWIRILFHLWKTRTTYSESTYLNQLRKTNSPLLKFLQTEA